MAKPSLDINLSAPDITAFKSKLNEASNHVGTVARQIAKRFLDTNDAIKDGLLASASSFALGMVGRIALVVGSYKLMSDAIGATREQLKEMVAIAEKASNLNVSPEFLQRFTAESKKLKVEAGELEGALANAFNATKDKSPIDISEWETGKEKITDVERALRVLNQEVAGGHLEGLVLFRDADTQEKKVIAVLKAMQQLEQIGQRAAALDLGERMFGSQFVDRIRQGKTSAESILTTMQSISVESGDIFPNDLMVRAKEIDDQLKIADNRLSDALKPSFNDLARIMLDIKSTWADVVGLIGQAVEWSNKLGFTSETARKKAELADIEKAIAGGTAGFGLPRVTDIPGVSKIYDAIGAEKPEDYLIRRRDTLKGELDAAARGEPEGPPAPTASRGAGPAPTRKQTDTGGADKLESASDSVVKRTAALQAEAAAIDLGTAAREKAKVVAQLETVAKQANAAAGRGENVVTADQRKLIDDVAAGYATAAQSMEKARIASSIKFDKQTALLDPSDVQIAQQLKDIYPSVATALGSVEAQAMRTNEAMKSISGTMSSSLTSGFADIIDGSKSVADSFASMGKTIVRAIEEAIIKLLIVQPLMRALGGALGGAGGGGAGLIGGLLGFADGGFVSGPGGPREDAIPARLSHGEFVVNSSATAMHRPLLEAINGNRVPRFADGGIVGDSPAPATGMISNIGGTTVAPTVNVTVQGQAGGSKSDHEALAATIGKQVNDTVKQLVAKELRTQTRPGGMLKN